MLILFLLSLLTYFFSTQAIETYDCGKEDKWLTLVSADVLPDPVIYPGNVTLVGVFDVKHELPDHDLFMSLHIVKLEPFSMQVPCLKGIGSCTYDVCKDLVPYHQKEFCELGSCKCPIPAKRYSTKGINYALPTIGKTVLKRILEGRYVANLTFHNPVLKQEYGCIGMKFRVKAAPDLLS